MFQPWLAIFRIVAVLMAAAFVAGSIGCGSQSSPPPPNNPVPSLASGTLSPSSVNAGTASFTLAVAGASFIPSSTVLWNGSSRTTTFVSSTSLDADINAADIVTGGTAKISVSNPSPGGGTSSALTFTINNPVPTITSLSPSVLLEGSPSFTLTITGTNFVTSSTALWNGGARPTTFVSSTSVQATIDAADIASGGTATVTVTNPTPGGGVSASVSFTVQFSSPSIALLSPSSAIAGGGPFTVTVTGANFLPSSSVQWNGSARPTTFISGTSLQAAITATDIAAIGTAKITVANAAANGGSSKASTFFVGSSGGSNFAVVVLNQVAQDIAFDSANSVFYLSVPGSSATNPNTISVLDLSDATITSSVPAGTNPNVLAISDDSQFLYAGIDGAASVQRFALPSLTKDISYSLVSSSASNSPFTLDIQIAPGAPHTSAVSIGEPGGPSAQGGIQIFDDATPRPTVASGFPGGGLYDSIQWGSDATEILAGDNEDSEYEFYVLSVNSSGVTLNQNFPGVFSGGRRIHFDAGTKLVYSDGGETVSPSSGLPVGNFDIAGAMIPDSTLNTVFFASQTSNSVTIQSLDQTHFIPLRSITVPNVTGNPIRLIRWGQNGLAFNTSSGQVVLVGGNFISPAPPFNVTPPPTPVTLPTPASNAPSIVSLVPSSTVAGGSALTMVVVGTNFNSASIVQFNENALATTFISSTQLTAAITAAEISTPGTASITVSNPSDSGGLSSPSTFFVGSTGGTSSAGAAFSLITLSQTSSDMASDPINRVIYLSVPASASNLGNTVAVLDLASAKIVGEQFAGSNPHVLAISDDSQFLYAGIDGASSVQRFRLPSLDADANLSLGSAGFFGPEFALDLEVAPGAPHTTAATLGVFHVSPNTQGGIKIFDDAALRATSTNSVDFNYISWGSDASTLFATGFLSSNLYVFSVTATDIAVSQDFPSAIVDGRLHFDAITMLVYTDSGFVVDPSTGLVVWNFNSSGLMVPDPTLHLAFFLIRSGTNLVIQSFNLTTFAPIDSMTIPNVLGNPQRLIRWGQNGLAFNTDAGQVYLIGGNSVH